VFWEIVNNALNPIKLRPNENSLKDATKEQPNRKSRKRI